MHRPASLSATVMGIPVQHSATPLAVSVTFWRDGPVETEGRHETLGRP